MASKKQPTGRPPKYKTPQEMQAVIDAYFDACRGEPVLDNAGEPMRNKNGHVIYDDRKPPTVTGLAAELSSKARLRGHGYAREVKM